LKDRQVPMVGNYAKFDINGSENEIKKQCIM